MRRNFGLPEKGKVLTPIAKFKQFESRDKNGNIRIYKLDLEFKRIGFSRDFFRDLMMNKKLKEIDYRVGAYILYQLNNGSDEIILNPLIIMRYIDKGRSTISASLKRLAKTGYIRPIKGRGTGKCSYEINADRFFCGDRIDFLEHTDPKLVIRVK